MLTYESWGTKWKITLKVSQYVYKGNTAIQMIDWNDGYAEPYACLTVNIAEETLPMNMAYVDENNLPGIGKWIEENKLGKFTGKMAQSGFCSYPLYEFDFEQIALHS